MITCASQRIADIHLSLNIALKLMKLPYFYLSKNRFCVLIYFLFSVQFIAAVYPFLSNHQCPYPHIPTPRSYGKLVAVCLTTALGIFSQFTEQVCTALQNPTFSLSLTFSYLPVLDAFIPLFHSLSLSVSLLLFLSVPLSQCGFPRSI